mmetsp:Transcript_76836/g.206152  ORF Transcript_76836/g.206152 Transcript_76836/m.206152 type:complete len:360 (-) Transcript_76836:9-1088(-)
MAQGERVPAAGRQLHRVLEQARPRGEARAGEAGGARVAVRDGRADAPEVEALRGGDLVELVRCGEVHVPPGVEEQLGGLGLLQLELHAVHPERGEERPRVLQARAVGARHDLRQLSQLPQRVALRDALRAEADAHVDVTATKCGQNACRGAGEQRGAQHEGLPALEVGLDLQDARLNDRVARVQVFVHGRADGDNHHVALAQGAVLGAQPEALGELGEAAREQLRATRLQEGEVSCADRLQLGSVAVDDDHVVASVCEHQRQRQAHVPGATHDGDAQAPGRGRGPGLLDARRDHERGIRGGAPAVEDRLARAEHEAGVLAMGAADEDRITLGDQVLCVHKVLSVDARVGAENVGTLPQQ